MQSSCDAAELSDLVVYATDMLATVDALLQTYPPGAAVFHAEGFDARLASFYSSCVVVLCRYLTRQGNFLPESEHASLLARLQFCRLSAVSVLRQMVEVRCLEKVSRTFLSRGCKWERKVKSAKMGFGQQNLIPIRI